jgi:hypothetical protein
MNAVVNESLSASVHGLLSLATLGLQRMYLPESQDFVQTVRQVPGPEGPRLVREGTSLRYAAIAANGLYRCDESVQRAVLAGATAVGLTRTVAAKALDSADPGAIALAAWAATENEKRLDADLFDRLREILSSGEPLAVVDVAWMLTAAVAAGFLGETEDLVETSRDLLLAYQGPAGIFPHALPAASLGRVRAHVGCFADQVYPIQALARCAAAYGDADSLVAANLCARRICDLQGQAGQWWWHYDSRGDSVVEGFPVYSVHQHAMAPMALMDLFDAGGDEHSDAIDRGVRWLTTHPEILEDLVDPRVGVVWRKVGRREPAKAVRKLNALTTAIRPGMTTPGLDRAFPTTKVDYECRPYELGWLLYAWQRPGVSRPVTHGEDARHG